MCYAKINIWANWDHFCSFFAQLGLHFTRGQFNRNFPLKLWMKLDTWPFSGLYTSRGMLISLHWLRVPVWITFKVVTLTYRALHGSTPPYLASSFTCVANMPHWQFGLPTVMPLLLLEQDVEWPAKRCYIGLIAVGVQEQAEDILVPQLLRNCLTLNDVFS